MARRAATVLTGLLVALACGAAHAQQGQAANPASLQQARLLFEQGLVRVREERWGEALELFQRARGIVERPSLVFNIGSALLRLGRLREAAPELERYLTLSDATADAAERAEATRMLVEARRGVATLTLTLSEPAATVEVDGAVVPGNAAERALALDPGEHRVRVLAEGFADERLEVRLAPGAQLSRAVALRAAPAQLQLTVSPPGASVRVDGRPVESRVVALSAGSHRVEASAPGYQRAVREVHTRAGGRLELELTLPREARASLASSPWLWTLVGVGVAGAAVGLTLGLVRIEDPVYRGTTNTALQGLAVDRGR